MILIVEVHGKILRRVECDYYEKDKIAAQLRRLYPDKNIEVCYYLESKINKPWHNDNPSNDFRLRHIR